MNYTLYLYNIIAIYINNNAVINNNYGRIQDLILFFKLPISTRKNFFAVYRKLGHAPSRKVAYSDPVKVSKKARAASCSRLVFGMRDFRLSLLFSRGFRFSEKLRGVGSSPNFRNRLSVPSSLVKLDP